jgi:hypothetical protein
MMTEVILSSSEEKEGAEMEDHLIADLLVTFVEEVLSLGTRDPLQT